MFHAANDLMMPVFLLYIVVKLYHGVMKMYTQGLDTVYIVVKLWH